MRLSQFNLPNRNVNKLMMLFRDQLAAVKDLDGRLINTTVYINTDAVLRDAINVTPPESAMPSIRIVLSPNQNDMNNEGGANIFTFATVSLYFLYYVGVPSQDVIETSFESLRNDHVFYNLDFLKLNQGLDSKGLDIMDWWRYTEQTFPVDHETPFKYLGDSVIIKNGYSCSRADLKVQVHNFIQANV